MIKRGFTIVELMISLSIMVIIITICFNTYLLTLREFAVLEGGVDGKANVRIAMDFITERIREGRSIIFGVEDVTIDGDRIYLRNNILRHGTDSQQIANNINSFGVIRVNDGGLYKVSVVSGSLCTNTLIRKRK